MPTQVLATRRAAPPAANPCYQPLPPAGVCAIPQSSCDRRDAHASYLGKMSKTQARHAHGRDLVMKPASRQLKEGEADGGKQSSEVRDMYILVQSTPES